MDPAKRKGISSFFAPAAAPPKRPAFASRAACAAAGGEHSDQPALPPTEAVPAVPAVPASRVSVEQALENARRKHLLAVSVAEAAAPSLPPLRSLLVDDEWARLLEQEFARPSFAQLEAFLRRERQRGPFFPPPPSVFRALNCCSPSAVRVVILGQDPYHGLNQACGLSFSVPRGEKTPSSLQNIFKELQTDVGVARPTHGDLERWAAQGVLLLNAVLTVKPHEANSHAKQGWEAFTDGVIRALVASHPKSGPPLVWMLWGKFAQDKARLVQGKANHVILQSPHPSGLSAHRGFFGCRHFSLANKALTEGGGEPIQWALDA